MEIFSLKIEAEPSVLEKFEDLKGYDVFINAWFGKMCYDFYGVPIRKEFESLFVKNYSYINLFNCVFNKLISEDFQFNNTVHIFDIKEAIYFNSKK